MRFDLIWLWWLIFYIRTVSEFMSPILDFIIWLLHILDPVYISHLVIGVRIPLASSFSQRPPDQNTFLSSRSCHIRCMCFSGISTVASARARSQSGFSCVRASLLRISAASNNCSIFKANGYCMLKLWLFLVALLLTRLLIRFRTGNLTETF